jgi:hypothetical protein
MQIFAWATKFQREEVVERFAFIAIDHPRQERVFPGLGEV